MNSTADDTRFTKTCYVFYEEEEMIVNLPAGSLAVRYLAVLCLLGAFLMVAVVVLNATAIITISRSSRLMEQGSNFFILVLSCIDLGVGLLALPLFSLFRASEAFGKPNCVVAFAYRKTAMILSLFSVTALSAMNVERYIAIIHCMTFKKKEMVVRKQLLKCVVSVCFVHLFVANMSSFSRHWTRAFRIYFGVFALLFLLSAVYIYVKIFVAATKGFRFRSHAGAERPETRPGSSPDSSQTPQNVSEVVHQKSNKRQILKNIKASKGCFLVVLCCVFCYLPMAMTAILTNLSGLELSLLISWLSLLVMLNSCLNSLIFFWRNPLLRKEIVQLLRKTFGM